ncbi:hypothetical protein EUX98_g4869 [Antrodiella citrinella]|uniref:Major facilitator superfamily (MFS) profile domain-containing protein n=1 Tax=Antrodiella citrinella TaxID=2447956 RepID=A0A4S4MVE0_9APHY|nr:hypothetical protein EUX98_g4869 [Antrodiella citrinella]
MSAVYEHGNSDKESQTKISKEVSEKSSTAGEDSNEGGRDTIMTIIGAVLANTVPFGVVNLVGPMQAYTCVLSCYHCNCTFLREEAGTMMGVMTAGSSIAPIVFPIALNKLIPVVGFPWAVRIIGFICLALLIPVVLMVESRLPRREYTGFSNVVDFCGLRDVRYSLFGVGAMLAGLGPVVLLSWLAVYEPAGFVLWGIVYGFFSGAFLSLSPACIARFTPDMT